MSNHISAEKIFDLDIHKDLNKIKILRLLETASRQVGEINNIVTNILEFDFIVAALKNIEALNSARIEGTTGNLKDLYLENALDFEKKKQLKLFSAINYKMAMEELEGIIRSHNRIDMALIRQLHRLLAENDPDTKGTPGKFRTNEVVIKNSKLGNFYPAHPNKVEEFMERFTKEVANKHDYPTLLQAAIMHYQFEAIHPFEDGNGRTGRILIVASLLVEKMLECAVLNLSQYFETNREEYISSLRSVSDNASYEEWIIFFLNAIIEQCKHNIELIKKLRELKDANELLINEQMRTPAATLILHHALNRLYITTSDTVTYLKARKLRGDLKQIARKNIQKLVDLGILTKTNRKFGKAEVYAHQQLKNMLTQ